MDKAICYFRRSAVSPLGGAASDHVFADDTELSRNTLKGITALEIIVEEIGSDIDATGTLRSQLRRDVETRLRLAGINVTSEAEIRPESAWLMLHVRVIRTGQFGYIYYADLRLAQPVRLL